MYDDPGQAETLHRLVEKWAALIGYSSGTTVEAILVQAESVLAALRELRPYGPKARRLLQAGAHLSPPMMSKLETIGRHAALMRPQAQRLPPSVSSLYMLSRKPWHRFLQAAEVDLRGMSPAGIRQLAPDGARPSAMRNLLTVKVACDVSEEARLVLIADIRNALAKIAEGRGIDLSASRSHQR